MKPGGRTLRAGSILIAWLVLTFVSSAATTNIYTTSFETVEGYNPALELAGQKGWTSFGSGGNGLLSDDPFFGPGQYGYIGFFPPATNDTLFLVWQSLNYSPPPNSVVTFSVKMLIVDSTNQFYDDFRWSVYNRGGGRLFTLDFDNSNLEISYGLDGTNSFVSTGRSFTNDVLYTLTLTMNFPSNRWSALLNGSPLVDAKPITTTGATLDLGDIDAVWSIRTQNRPGNNYMLFDDYRVESQIGSSPAAGPFRLQFLGKSVTGPFALRLTGDQSRDYAIEATSDFSQWAILRTNSTAGDGTFDFVDTGASTLARRFYRARLVR